jgi:ubiquitin carboxyl-terminal hydrolase 7
MVEPMKAKQSLKAAELQDGDIVCFQRVPDGRNSEPRSSDSDRESISHLTSRLTLTDSGDRTRNLQTDRIEHAPSYYDFLLYKRVVTFYPHARNLPGQEPFTLELSSKHTYDQFASRVGDKLGVPNTHLKFWTMNHMTGNIKAAVKRGQSQTLHNVLNPPYGTLNNNNQRPDSLIYEILDMSLAELDTKKAMKIIWVTEGITKEVSVPYVSLYFSPNPVYQDILEVLVAKNGTVEDLITGIIKKGKLDDEATAGPIRIYESNSNKIYKELPRELAVLNITDYVQLVAERIPQEDLDATEFISAFHFQSDPSKSHGIPFKFHIKEVSKILSFVQPNMLISLA